MTQKPLLPFPLIAPPTDALGPYANVLAETGTNVVRRWFSNAIVPLDGYTFVQCRFDVCTLYYATHDFNIQRCFFDRCQIVHSIAGVRSIRMYWMGMGMSASDHGLGTFAPVRHADGTYSLDHEGT
jgi:hypothetical protein